MTSGAARRAMGGVMSTAQRLLLPILLGCVALSGACSSGGGDAGGADPGPDPGNGALAVTGTAAKGRVDGTVTAFTIDPKTGARLAQVAQAQTAADGSFALSFDGAAGPVLLVAAGTHRDEVTGQNLPIDPERPLVALFNAAVGDNEVSLSGLTTIHAAAALTAATSVGVDVEQAVTNARIALQDFYGIGDLFAAPALGGAPDDGTKLLALNGGFSQLGVDLGVDPLAVLEALARDFAGDGRFDGRDRNELVFADGQALAADAGTAGLVDAARRGAGTLAGPPVVQDALDEIAFAIQEEPRRAPELFGTTSACGPVEGGDEFVILGRFEGSEFEIVVGGKVVPADDVTGLVQDGRLVGFRVRAPSGDAGPAPVVVRNIDDGESGQAGALLKGYRYKNPGEGAPQVDRSRGTPLVSRAGGTPLQVDGENLGDASFVPSGDDTPLETDFQSNRGAQLVFPAQGDQGPSVRQVDAINAEGSDFVEGEYADEPESEASFTSKVASLEGTWCFFFALRAFGEEVSLRFEFEFNADGTGTRREVFDDGSLGEPESIEVEAGPGESLGIPIPVFFAEPLFQGSLANEGNLFLAAADGAVVIGFRKPDGFSVSNVRDEYSIFAAVETGPEGDRTASIFNGSMSFNEGRTEATMGVERTITGTGLENIVPAASGKANFNFSSDGSAGVAVDGHEDLSYNIQFSPFGDCFLAWFCNEDPDCFFQGVMLGFAKADGLEMGELGGNWGGICTTWSASGGWSSGDTYGVGSLNEELKGSAATFSEFGEKLDDDPDLSPPVSTWFMAGSRDLSLTACGEIRRESAFGIGGTYGMVKEGGDMALEVDPTGAQTRLLFGNEQAPFGISIRTRIPEFQSVHTFTGDMNEIELSLDNGFGSDASDLTVRTRTVRRRTLSTAVRRLRTMGFFFETIQPVVKTVERVDNGAPTVETQAESDDFDEVYTVVGDHLFVFPVAGQPGQSIDGLPPVIAQGRIAANGNFAVLQAPHQRHGILFRILAKQTDAAPDLAGMTYHFGCLGVVFDPETDDDRLRYSRGTITFNADGTFDADIVEADEDPENLVTVFSPLEITGTFAVEDDGRITVTPDGGSPLSGMVTRSGNAIFLVNADGASTDSEFCIAVKQATQVPAFQRTVLRRLRFEAQAGFAGGSLFVKGGRADLIRSGTDFRISEFDHVSPANASTGRSEFFFNDATSVLEADGTFTLSIGFVDFKGGLSEDGVIGFVMQGSDFARSNGIDILVGR